MVKKLLFHGVVLPYHVLSPLSPATVAADTGTYAICISPDGTSVYAVNNGNSDASQYGRNAVTGLLAAYSPANVVAGLHSTCIAISLDGTSVYVGSCDSTPTGHIYQYSRNTSTGLLLPYTPAYVSFAANKMMGIVVSPDGKNVYVSCYDGNIYQFSRNTGTGLLSPLGTPSIASGSLAGGISISSDGNYVYCGAGAGIYQYSRNATTGFLSPLSPSSVSAGSFQQGLNAISPDGNFFYSTCYNGTDNNIYQYSRNTGTGLLSPLTPAYVTVYNNNTPYGVFISPDGAALFTSGYSTNIVTQFSRNTSSGQISTSVPVSISTTSGPTYGITGSSDNTFVYATSFNGNNISQFSRS